VLLTRKGSFGLAAVVPKEAVDCLISSEVILLRLSPDANCNPDYLVSWLNSEIAQAILNRHKSGGIMGHLTQDVVSELPIPLPPKEIQTAIAAEVTHRRTEARRLRAAAATEWAAAKAQFEHELLGESIKS
ncbi:MAG: restriction endonuclease subunit S, partial [Verrucomicrobiia bacterium]